MTDELRIVLVGGAKKAHDQMLGEVRADGKTTINSSRLINWIVSDYFEHFYQKQKKKLFKENSNSRKCILEAMKIEDPSERRRALQEATKQLGPPTKKVGPKDKPTKNLGRTDAASEAK